jgi:hypothetical protein
MSRLLKQILSRSSSLVAIASHDAGGSEVLSSFIKRNPPESRPLYFLSGPAVDIFRKKLGDIDVTPPHSSTKGIDYLVCSTSWQSDIEFNMIRSFRLAGKSSVAFLDHWTNYKQRFQRNGRFFFPNEIVVGDFWALDLARSAFPRVPIGFVQNAFFQDFLECFASAEVVNSEGDGDGTRVLYICEPINDQNDLISINQKHLRYTGKDALNFFLQNITALGINKIKLTVRPHPSESIEKYSWVLSKVSDAKVNRDESIATALACNDIVVGCNSMAMVLALIVNKRVLCSIPDQTSRCVLPAKEIEYIHDLINKNGAAV